MLCRKLLPPDPAATTFVPPKGFLLMTETMKSNGREPTRRSLLRGAGVLGGGAALAATGIMTGSSVAAPSKMTQKVAGYRDKPMGSAHCDNCGVWQTPDACKLVQGPISPNGWCSLYSPKA